MKKKRLVNLVNTLTILVFVFSIVGCSTPPIATTAVPQQPTNTQAPKPTDTQAVQPTAASPVSPAGQFPIVKDKITLKILLRQTANVSDYVNNDFTKWLEDKTNIHLEFDLAPVDSNEANQKLNLVLGSGDLPDLIMGFSIPPAQQQVLANQGLIIPLDSFIDQYGFEFKTVMKDMPQLRTAISLTDGKVYALPDLNDCYHCSLSQKAWIYKPWLDKLGLKIPTTTDELEQVLITFKEKDPNGNGKADEIPWSGAYKNGWNSELDTFIMNSFVLDSRLTSDRALYIENGKVMAAFAQPGWKDGTAYLAKLYKEGLIDPQIFTNDFTKQQAMGENPVPIMGFTGAGFMGMFTEINGKSGRWLDYVPVPPLKGPSGLQQTPQNPYSAIIMGMALISKSSKYPEAAFRLVDLMYSFEATQRSVLGRPGIEWDYSQAGAVSISGGVAKWKALATNSTTQQSVNWNQAAPTYRSSEFRLSQEYDPKDPLERLLYQNSKDNYAPYGKPDQFVPPLLFTPDQSKRLSELNTVLYNLVDTQFAAFVTGQADVSKDWDKYLADLKNDGLDEFLQIYQTAYDAKYKK